MLAEAVADGMADLEASVETEDKGKVLVEDRHVRNLGNRAGDPGLEENDREHETRHHPKPDSDFIICQNGT